MSPPTLRVARPTNHLQAMAELYAAGLGLELLGGFEDHEGFDGIMVGQPGVPYHLEFTSKRGHPVAGAPSEDNLLVFYVPDEAEWAQRCAAMAAAGFAEVPSFNPYWDQRGKTFEDPEGYRVVIQQASWPAS